jgi:hypothetical protein
MSEVNSTIYIANTASQPYSFYVPPKYSGCYKIGPPKYSGCYRIGGNYGLSISIVKKPNWFHRKMMALCLGWEWIDGSPL